MIRIRLGFGLRDTIDSSTAPQLHGPAGLGASAPQLRGFRDFFNQFKPISEIIWNQFWGLGTGGLG